QPKIESASRLQRIRHYRNLGKMSRVLTHYLDKYEFTSMADYLGLDRSRPSTPSVGQSPGSPIRPHSPADSQANLAPLNDWPATPRKTPVSVVIPCFNEAQVLPYLQR